MRPARLWWGAAAARPPSRRAIFENSSEFFQKASTQTNFANSREGRLPRRLPRQAPQSPVRICSSERQKFDSQRKTPRQTRLSRLTRCKIYLPL